jgi:hypothetical protein
MYTIFNMIHKNLSSISWCAYVSVKEFIPLVLLSVELIFRIFLTRTKSANESVRFN